MIDLNIYFVAGVLRKKSALCKGNMPNHFLSDAFPMRNLQNQITYKNMNTQKKIQCNLYGDTGHNCCNCPRKYLEGVVDGFAGSGENDAVHDLFRLEDGGKSTA